jgi:hypothetical protein
MRGEANNMMDQYKAAIEDFTIIIGMNKREAKAYYRRGLDYLAIKNKKLGCQDLLSAGDLGYFEAYEAINKYCKREKKLHFSKKKKK